MVPHPLGAQSTRDGKADLYISDYKSVENSMTDMPRVNGNADIGVQPSGERGREVHWRSLPGVYIGAES